MVTRIESVITNASGVPSAISKCVPIDQNKKLHDDGSVRKVFYFKCNHCLGKFSRMELRNKKNTVQHICLTAGGSH